MTKHLNFPGLAIVKTILVHRCQREVCWPLIFSMHVKKRPPPQKVMNSKGILPKMAFIQVSCRKLSVTPMKTLLVNWQRVQLCWCIAQNLNWWHSVILCSALVEWGVCINSKWLLARQCLLSCHSMRSRSWQLPHCDIRHVVSTQTHQWFWDRKSRWSYHHPESLLFQYHTGRCRQRHHPENRCAYLALPSLEGIKHGWHVGVGLDPPLTELLRYHRPTLWGVCHGAFQECCVEFFCRGEAREQLYR